MVLRFVCANADAVTLHIWDGTETYVPMAYDGVRTYSVKWQVSDAPHVCWYDFIVVINGQEIFYGNAQDGMGGEGCVQSGVRHAYQITVYDPAFTVSGWMPSAVIYQIFPDRFCRMPTESVCARGDRVFREEWSGEPMWYIDPQTEEPAAHDFYSGTLNGIREKLPYLQDLGVTVLYLNPVFKSASNHRYDTGDYHVIDPLLGTCAEFSCLCAEARSRGMRVILDGVFSHTGADSLYFNRKGTYPSLGAYQSEDSPYASWYRFTHFPNQYRSWWNVSTLPEVNKEDASYRHFLFEPSQGVVPLWLRRGASGWRLDVADELSMDFIRALKQSARREACDAFILGEVWEDASHKIAYGEARCYCLGDTLDSVMNYPLRAAIIAFLTLKQPAGSLARLIRRQQEVYPVPFRYALMNLLGSHDRARILNALVQDTREDAPPSQRALPRLEPDDYALASCRLVKAYEILCALPGAPSVYYGDEAGMQGGGDPFCRGPFPWGKQDSHLHQTIRSLLHARRDNALFSHGKMEVSAPDEDTLVIVRYFDGEDAFGGARGHERAECVIRREGRGSR